MGGTRPLGHHEWSAREKLKANVVSDAFIQAMAHGDDTFASRCFTPHDFLRLARVGVISGRHRRGTRKAGTPASERGLRLVCRHRRRRAVEAEQDRTERKPGRSCTYRMRPRGRCI